MDAPSSYIWTPIQDLPPDWATSLSNPQTMALVGVWHEQAGELRDKDLYKQFLARLQRQWAIETGVLEGLYTLSEGATLALIEKGLDASLITHEDTNDEPDEVIAKIQDQHQAIQGLYQFISGERPLGTSYIKELHQVLTAHQRTYTARDTLGNIVTRQLPRGIWKTMPNNVEHPDGTRFEYCPPEHVAQEMDNLISMYQNHEKSSVPPDVEAAWIHHRFTLIHPFTDGNGRVARCLATLILLRAHWLPLVVTRKERTDYIGALRGADAGDLKPLVDLFGSLQRRAIREALSLSDDVIQDATAIKGILQTVRDKFSRQRQALSQSIERSFATADSLQILARQRLAEVAVEINDTLATESAQYRARMSHAPRESNEAMYHYIQIVECAKALKYFANLRRYQAWARLVIVTRQNTEILFSFHGIGHEESGILGCAAMAYTKERGEKGEGTFGEVTPLVTEPFEFSYADEPDDVQKRFRKWLDQCVIVGLDYWQRSL